MKHAISAFAIAMALVGSTKTYAADTSGKCSLPPGIASKPATSIEYSDLESFNPQDCLDDLQLRLPTTPELQIAFDAMRDVVARYARLKALNATKAAAASRKKQYPGEQAIENYETLREQDANAALQQQIGPYVTALRGGLAYAGHAISSAQQVTPPKHDAPAARERQSATISPDCRNMIFSPRAYVKSEDKPVEISTCAADAARFAQNIPVTGKKKGWAAPFSTIPGNEVRVPGSILNPPGFAALLSGSGSEGSAISMTLTRQLRARSLSGSSSIQGTAGLSSGNGILFTQDKSKPFSDRFDSKAKLSLQLQFNHFETLHGSGFYWEAKNLRNEAIAACLKSPPTDLQDRNTGPCEGINLTNWVYAVKEDGSRINEDIANHADEIYFSGKETVPKWGFGAGLELAHASFDYVTPAAFAANFAGKFDDAFKRAAVANSSAWLIKPSAYAYLRISDVGAPLGLSAIVSGSRTSTLGYVDGYEKPLFCPATIPGAPFSTNDCKRYYGKAPDREKYYSVAGELRATFPLLSVNWVAAPKFTRDFRNRENGNPYDLRLPLLAFTNLKRTEAVGFIVDWGWGEVDSDKVDKPNDVSLQLTYQKAFSLTGN